jgi:hypothetical protein
MNKLSTLGTRPGSINVVGERTVAALALALALAWIGWTAISWFRYHPHMPWRDLFLLLRQIMDLTEAGPELATLWQWFEPHYDTHRIAILRLLLLVDTRLLDGQSHIFYGAAWLCLLVLVFLYARLALSYFGETRCVLFTAALAGIWLFSPSHWWNLVNAINVSWHLSLTSAALAFYLLVRRAEEPRFREWCGAYLLCALAAFSNFAGVLAWLMLPLLACLIQPRALLPTLLVSGACAWLYAGGMTSDASIASQWDVGTAEVIASIRLQAEAALAANTPLRILEKTLQFLGWPLFDRAPRLAMGLGLGSAVILAMALTSALISELRSSERLHPLFTFSLMMAGLCLCIALATQLGRLMEHPNHAHGPSYERYQTVVVVYWLSVSVLVMGHRPRHGVGGPILFAGLLLLAWVLQVPTGNYLREEIQSTQAAARLFDRGRIAHVNGLKLPPGNRYIPEYVYHFDAYFARRQLAYRAPMPEPADMDRVEQCATGTVDLEFGEIQEFTEYPRGARPRAVNAKLTLPGSWMSRAIVLYQGEKPVGRLSPVHRGDYTPYALVDSASVRWEGIIAGFGAGDLIVVLHGLTGTRAVCVVSELEVNKFAGVGEQEYGSQKQAESGPKMPPVGAESVRQRVAVR